MPDPETPAEPPEGAQPEGDEAPQEEAPPADLGDAGKQALDRMKAERNAAKAEAKQLQSQLEELQRAQMTDQEKAIDEARAAARAEVMGEISSKVVAAEFKAAAAGRLDDAALTNLLGGLNLASFLDESGEVDTDKVANLVASIAPTPASADFGQGARSTASSGSDPLTDALKNAVGVR